MNKHWRIALALLAALALLGVAACSDDDDDNGGSNPTPPDPWEGTWLSAGANVAPILTTWYDSVRVVFNADQTVELYSHSVDSGTWIPNTGTYAVTESATGDVHSIAISYSAPAFDQEGIIQVVEGTPDTFNLEVVQTVPDIGATPRTPATGFGSDPVLGTTNIQVYVREL